jgi:hypothetical protein
MEMILFDGMRYEALKEIGALLVEVHCLLQERDEEIAHLQAELDEANNEIAVLQTRV